MSSKKSSSALKRLTDENSRLFCQLISSHKCLTKLNELKKILILFSNKIKTNTLRLEEWTKIEKIIKEVNRLSGKKDNNSKISYKSVGIQAFGVFTDCDEVSEEIVEETADSEDSGIGGIEEIGDSSSSCDEFMDCENGIESEKAIEEVNNEDKKQKKDKDPEWHPIDEEVKPRRLPNKTFKCGFAGCGQQFRKESDLREHINRPHPLDETFDCPLNECVFQTTTKPLLIIHLASKHKKQKYEIPFRFGDFVCEICGKDFAKNRSLYKHKLSVHRRVKHIPCTHTGCRFVACSQDELKRHSVVHSDEFPFACPVDGCGKTFKREFSLQSHCRSHSDERSFECYFNGCGKRFKSKSYLYSHHQIEHFKSREIRCDWPECEFKTRSKTTYNRHKLNHTNVRKHVCDRADCGAKFKTKPDLNIHKARHEQVNRFQCPWPGCPYQAYYQGQIKLHEKVHTRPFACHWPGCEYRTARKCRLVNEHIPKYHSV